MATNQKAVIDIHQKEDATSSKLEAIKNLIFGDDIQAYNSEFEAVKQDILDKKKILEELVEETRTELAKAIDDVSTDLNIRITELEGNLEDKIEHLETEKIDKNMLGKILVELGEKLGRK